MKTTPYFNNEVASKHPESVIYRDFIEKALYEYDEIKTESNGNTRRWIYVPERELYMRVVVLPDHETVLNAFFDTAYTKKKRR